MRSAANRIARQHNISTCLWVLLLSLGSLHPARAEPICSWAQDRVFTLSEYRDGRVTKEFLVQGRCTKNTEAEFEFEGERLLSVHKIDGSLRAVYSKETPFEVRPTWHGSVLMLSGRTRQLQLRMTEMSHISNSSRELRWPPRSLRRPDAAPVFPDHAKFGASRAGKRFHTGLDVPTRPGEEILAPVSGRVVLISHLKTQMTIFLKPIDGGPYVGIAHLREPAVTVGQYIDNETVLGRALTKDELKRTKHAFSHVHLELRREINDFGGASVDTFSKSKLLRIFTDPIRVFKGIE